MEADPAVSHAEAVLGRVDALEPFDVARAALLKASGQPLPLEHAHGRNAVTL